MVGQILTRQGTALVKLDDLEEGVGVYQKALTEHRCPEELYWNNKQGACHAGTHRVSACQWAQAHVLVKSCMFHLEELVRYPMCEADAGSHGMISRRSINRSLSKVLAGPCSTHAPEDVLLQECGHAEAAARDAEEAEAAADGGLH